MQLVRLCFSTEFFSELLEKLLNTRKIYKQKLLAGYLLVLKARPDGAWKRCNDVFSLSVVTWMRERFHVNTIEI